MQKEEVVTLESIYSNFPRLLVLALRTHLLVKPPVLENAIPVLSTKLQRVYCVRGNFSR